MKLVVPVYLRMSQNMNPMQKSLLAVMHQSH